MRDEEPKRCFRCHVALQLNDEMEWHDDEVPLFCCGCQHAEIKDLVKLVRRLGRTLKRNIPECSQIADQSSGYLKRHGYRSSILRDEK